MCVIHSLWKVLAFRLGSGEKEILNASWDVVKYGVIRLPISCIGLHVYCISK